MRRLVVILFFFSLFVPSFSQEETRVVDSLLSIVDTQEGREKVLTMIELTWEFYDISFDDGISWGEQAIKEAHELGLADLEADATYALGMQYGYHADLDLAKVYLNKAFEQHLVLEDEANALKDLSRQAYFEQTFGKVDSALLLYDRVLFLADKLNDSSNIANAYFNKAILFYHNREYSKSETSFSEAKMYYEQFGDTVSVTHVDANLANLYMEWGNTRKARRLFNEVIPRLENNNDYSWLFLAYKNYGQLFVKESANHDSAYYYYSKANALQELLIENGIAVPINYRIDLMVEMGNTSYNMGDYNVAIHYFEQSLSLAEANSYIIGQLMACFGLGTTYSTLWQPKKSIYYMNRFLELESKSGVTIARSSMRFTFVLNYARLGKFEDMEKHLGAIQEKYEETLLENADLYEQNDAFHDDMTTLLNQYESQSAEIETLQSQRDQYRFAFFGLLAIALFALALLIAYRIVRKKRAKSAKS